MNVHRCDDFGEFQSNLSKQNQLGGFDNFDEFSHLSLLHVFLDISSDPLPAPSPP